MSFIQEGYEVPASKNNYMKFKQGANKLRILSDAETGWIWWTTENVEGKEKQKPNRVRTQEEIRTEELTPSRPAKHFWAMMVWNYQDNMIQLLELTQSSIQREILDLDRSEWGNPKNYDITVTKTGDGMETKYGVRPTPQAPLKKEIAEEWKNMNINLSDLFDGKDIFESNEQTNNQPQISDDPFAEPPIESREQ